MADTAINIRSKPMPFVSGSMHMGILWSANPQESAIQENIKKARRTIHSLMGAGLHGENGLDPDTSIHLLQIYVVPVFVYGLEVVPPSGVHLDKLERLHKQCQTQGGWGRAKGDLVLTNKIRISLPIPAVRILCVCIINNL